MDEVIIKVRESGPYLIRCGGSQNKPFCDGTHRENGFAATERAAVVEQSVP